MFIFLIFLLLFGNVCKAQHLFQKTFGTTDYEEIWGFELTGDNGFILAGYTGFGSAYLIKLDSEIQAAPANENVVSERNTPKVIFQVCRDFGIFRQMKS